MTDYTSNVSDSQWQVIKKYLSVERKRKIDLREIWNAVLYVVKTGIQWRYLPKDFPKWATVFYYFDQWKHRGAFQKIQLVTAREIRVARGRKEEPTAAVMDSQSVKATLVSTGGHTGFEEDKRGKAAHCHGHDGGCCCTWSCTVRPCRSGRGNIRARNCSGFGAIS